MQELKIKRDDFTRIDIDPDHYYYSLKIPNSTFEICLEPCAGGFDVSLFNEVIKSGVSFCTNSDGYLESPGALFRDRKDEDWNKAIEFANDLIANHCMHILGNIDFGKNNEITDKGNDLISGEEIKALRAKAAIITLQDVIEIRFYKIEPMYLKSKYCVSLTIAESPIGNQIEILSVGSHGKPDPADSESIATAILGSGYTSIDSMLPFGNMVHFWKRRK